MTTTETENVTTDLTDEEIALLVLGLERIALIASGAAASLKDLSSKAGAAIALMKKLGFPFAEGMTEAGVVALMRGSQTEEEWNANADTVKRKCNGYPSFWYKAIVDSGLLKEVATRWGSAGSIRIGEA